MVLFTFGEGYHNYYHEFQHDYPKRREAMAMGSDQMADPDSLSKPRLKTADQLCKGAWLRRSFTLLRYSSLLAQCLRLVSYATGALPDLRLRAFYRRSSLPSLCHCIADNFVAALLCQIPAGNNSGRGDVKPSRLLDLLSLTNTR